MLMMVDDNDDECRHKQDDDDVDLQKGGKILGKGRIDSYYKRLASKGNVGSGGARKIEESRKVQKDAMRMMMERNGPFRKISKTITKKKQGAKSRIKKGKLVGTIMTDSSQQGIGRFLFKANMVIGAMEIGRGEVKSLGSSRNTTKTSCEID